MNVAVTIIENGCGNMSSNPEKGCFHIALIPLEKV